GNEGPVLFPRRALLDPAADERDLAGVEPVGGPDWRHAHRGIRGCDAADHFAGRRIARHDSEMAAQILFRSGFGVKPQLALSISLVRPVAGVALVGKDRPDVAVELDLLRLGPALCQAQCRTD